MQGSEVWRLVIPKERISSEKVICKLRRTRSKRERVDKRYWRIMRGEGGW